MMKSNWLFLSAFFVFAACRSKKESEIIQDNLRIVGNIDQDSNYQGLMKFYDLQTGRLLYESNYSEGKLDGETRTYDSRDRLFAIENFSKGNLNGFTYGFDSSGKIHYQTYYYYGLPVGPNIYYGEGGVQSYNFYSLCNERLIQIEYDSIGEKKISEIQKSFFFFEVRRYDKFENGKIEYDRPECFIYLPNPPRYNFAYSLVRIDSSYRVTDTLKNIKSDMPFVTFFLPIDSGNIRKSQLALKLDIYDSANSIMAHAFKRIEP